MTDIVIDRLTKRFGPTTAVDDLSFTVHPGVVTGFLGPNGAGKTTTMQVLLGLISATSGRASVGGTPYADLRHPAHTVGALLEADAFHPGRSGRDHLRVVAAGAGIARSRVDEVLEMVGLADAADRHAGGYSLGMRQRLGLATALLGEPEVLVLDEPANGLDPQGVRWLRDLLAHYASNGATVLVSSHLLNEMALIAEEVVVIRDGRLVTHGRVDEVTTAGGVSVRVAGPDLAPLLTALEAEGSRLDRSPEGAVQVAQADAATIGALAHQLGVELHELTPVSSSLEDAFLEMTR
jgi:ABC-2 type transport system ATP-binding protein